MEEQTERKGGGAADGKEKAEEQTERNGGGGSDGKEKAEEQVPELSDICWCAARP